MRIAYLFSRYPVVSQTFCDTELIALERLGLTLEVGSIHPPLTSLRHEHAGNLHAPIQYAPPPQILRIWEDNARSSGRWPAALVEAHTRNFGEEVKASQRARNALYFADLFRRRGIDHFHVHFANRAAHTALFIKALSGIPFSVTAHGQDFMVDLNNDNLLREICREAEFVAAETDYSCGLLRERCPDSADKIHRVYNGMDLANFPRTEISHRENSAPVRIVSVGRLIEFKGFQHLIAACATLRDRGLGFRCEIIGEGPWREALEKQIGALHLTEQVHLAGARSQQEIFAELRHCDIFSLACVCDRAGASDVFPTVILEAMASARPVVSTQLAGVPESVVHGETGLLVPPGDVPALADAMARLIGDSLLRQRFGTAGRTRVEEHFQVESTVLALQKLFEKHAPSPAKLPPMSRPAAVVNRIAYLIDTWPDGRLPNLETEILAMKRRNISVQPFACEVPLHFRRNAVIDGLAGEIIFLPDATVIEAGWQHECEAARTLENARNEWARDVPSDVFFRQARFALACQSALSEGNFLHVHATSSSSLICALLLKRTLGISISATIETNPVLPRKAMLRALADCAGGRVSDHAAAKHLGSAFMLDHWTSRRGGIPAKLASPLSALGLTGDAAFWQQWAERLVVWSHDGQRRASASRLS